MKENERLKLGTTKIILISTGVTSLVLIMAALVIGSLPLLVNMILLSMLLLVVPYSAYKFIRLKRIKSYEDELPNFLRDMSESVRADLSLIQAIHAGARSDYGMLTQEVQKMSNQLSWNVPLEKEVNPPKHDGADHPLSEEELDWGNPLKGPIQRDGSNPDERPGG